MLFVFSQIFGEHNEDEDVAPDREDPEAAGDAAGATALEKESNKDVSSCSLEKCRQ